MADLLVSSQDGILGLTLNRPGRRNALSPEIIAGLLEALSDEMRAPRHRVVVITGAGGSFCAGADLDPATILQRRATIEGEMKAGINRIIGLIRELPLPVIASVDGAAAGAGVGLALAADFMIVSDSARLHIAFPRIGAGPDAGVLAQLVFKIGAARASALAMLGGTISGEAAERDGLAWRRCGPERLAEETAALAGELARGPTLSYGITKRLVNAMLPAADARYLGLEAACQARAFASDDFAEGIAAFAEGRRPVFTGR